MLTQGTQVCVPLQDIEPAIDFVFYPLVPPSAGGMVWNEMILEWEYNGDCATKVIQTEHGTQEFSLLSWVYAQSPQQALQTIEIQEKWYQEFGTWILGRVWLNDWGRLSLPLEYLTPEEQEKEYTRERLQSSKQKSKATVAKGPRWLHFLGTDNMYTDVWGSIEHVQGLVSLTQDWHSKCMSDTAVTNKEACIIQIGDISWFNPRKPDPLGHKTHDKGRCVDLRLFRRDGSRYEAFWNRGDDRDGFKRAYDLHLNSLFIDFLWEQGMEVVLFSDKRTQARWAPRHNDHIHFCFAEENP
jgi:hypothetical protein